MGVETAILAVGTVASVFSSEKARKEQRSARKAQERIRQVQDAKSRMAAVREQRIAQAQIVQGAATEGTMESSAAQGGYSAVGSLTSGNIQFINQMDSLQQRVNSHMNKADQWAGYASTAQAVGNLALAMAPAKAPSSGGASPQSFGGSISGDASLNAYIGSFK